MAWWEAEREGEERGEGEGGCRTGVDGVDAGGGVEGGSYKKEKEKEKDLRTMKRKEKENKRRR